MENSSQFVQSSGGILIDLYPYKRNASLENY
jgi:hypothetical protein